MSTGESPTLGNILHFWDIYLHHFRAHSAYDIYSKYVNMTNFEARSSSHKIYEADLANTD